MPAITNQHQYPTNGLTPESTGYFSFINFSIMRPQWCPACNIDGKKIVSHYKTHGLLTIELSCGHTYIDNI